jgi:hypothetical protein
LKTEGATISHLLKKVYLGGIVEEAIVDFGANTVQAVDPTNSVFLKVSEKPSGDGIGRVGIGSPTLSMIIKHFDAIKGEIAITHENNRLVVGAKGRGEVRYLTVKEEFVASAVAEDNIGALVDPCILTATLPAQSCSDFMAYMALVKTKSAKFRYSQKTKTVHIESGLESEHQFNVPVGAAELLTDDKPEDFSVMVYGSHIDQIFGVLEWSEKEKPAILMAPNHPLLIVQNDENIWACLPLTESAEEQQS